MTGNLIGRHHFDDEWDKTPRDSDRFLEQVQAVLLANDVEVMKPETLGRIMCSFEARDGIINRLSKDVSFVGGGLLSLRRLVARALAYAIRDRLDMARPNPAIPSYRRGVQENVK